MDIPEEQWFPLSAVSHWSFCPRRCALVHTECVWTDNYFTASGEKLHAIVDKGGTESRKERRFARSLRLFSRTLGISGIADVVEFHRDDEAGAEVHGWIGKWLPYPVEYKWGTARNETPYERQLCAQAMCLEEMFQVAIPEGALFLGVEKRRRPVNLQESLRNDTRTACSAIRNLLASGETPPPSYGKWCASCSLVEECRPKLVSSRRSVKTWLRRELEAIDGALRGNIG